MLESNHNKANIDFRYYLEIIEQVKKENEQLKELNRKLVDELEIYRYKDSLKEAEYIIEHQYNDMLIPQRYKYLFDQKHKYLSAINFTYKAETQTMKEKAISEIDHTRIFYAEEHEEMQQLLSEMIDDMRFLC